MLDGRPKRTDRPEEALFQFPPKKWVWYALAALVVMVGLVGAGFVLRSADTQPKRSWRQDVIEAGQDIVRNSLVEGIRPSFAGDDETTVESLPEKKFMVSGWVDLVTEAGRHARQNYSVIVYKDPTKSWVGEQVTVIPQM